MSSKPDFGAKLNELETITEWFESDDVDLNEALKKFERGMELATSLKKELQDIENRVEVIKQRFDGAASPVATDSIDATEPEASDNEPTLF